MTDYRPQYGEIATPEEQRQAAGLPPISEVEHPASQQAVTEPLPRRYSVDRFVTFGLLTYGLVNVILAAFSYLNYEDFMVQTMKVLGIEGEFTNIAQGRLWGTIAAVVLVVGWCVTAALSIKRLRRGRLAWWVPLVGAVITVFVAAICAAIPMMGDPAFIASVSRGDGA